MRQRFYQWLSEMSYASGEVLDDRRWSTTYTTAPQPGVPAVEMFSPSVSNGLFNLEYDERVGWLTNGPVFEATDSLTNGWLPIVPASFQQLDRFLDKGTCRVALPTDTRSNSTGSRSNKPSGWN